MKKPQVANYFSFLLISILLLQSCAKNEPISGSLKADVKRTSSRVAADTTKTVDFDFLSLTSPLRDILKYNPGYLNKMARTTIAMPATGGGGPNYHCCNGICLAYPENPAPGVYYYPFDAFGNRINYIGQYGPDGRNVYYVSLPASVNANSPIVVMIHGGGWFSGPDGSILGFPFNWGSDSTVSIVKDLLNNGYVVVSMDYRLAQLGNNNSEFISNPISWQDQIDDIDLAIKHIRTNFPTCLWGVTLNANKIHLLGESSGGHIALMYAYTKADPTYIKSVIAMYAPTNLQTFDSWIMNKPYAFSCNGAYTPFDLSLVSDCDLHFKLTNHHATFYWSVDYNQPYVVNNVFLNTCITNNNASSIHIYEGHWILESAAKQTINTPLTNTTLYNFSPRYASSVGVIPTFIMHGREDNIVPYDNATTGMQSALTGAGGVVFTDNVTNTTPMPSSYTTRHLIRKYCRANHSWFVYDVNQGISTTLTNNLKTKIRQDVITWYNNH